MIVWVCSVSRLAAEVVPWNSGLSKGVVIWFLTAGIVTFGNFEKVSKEPHFFRRTILGVLVWSSFVEFYLDLYQMPLLGEVLLQPVLTFLMLMLVIAGKKEEHHQVKSSAEALLALLALGCFRYRLLQIARSPCGNNDLRVK